MARYKATDLTGKTFGRLKVMERVGKDPHWGKPIWRCVCECGVVCDVRSNNLVTGNTKSCGCYRSEVVRSRAKA